ncbi:MAG TPA: YbaK/EbsC family protein [Anaerolineales bacterium]|nr:YbaK/EbsC family protein [Anaerolineales bacterium]
MTNSTPVTQILSAKGVPYQVFRHPGPIASLQQAANERGQRPEQVVRSIVFRLSHKEFVMVLMNGPGQVSWATLRHFLNQSRLSMASQAEVLASTGYHLGAVSPFGLPAPMRVLLDEGVLAEEEISIGSGVRGVTVILKTKDFLEALDKYEVGRFKSD